MAAFFPLSPHDQLPLDGYVSGSERISPRLMAKAGEHMEILLGLCDPCSIYILTHFFHP
jgi:hypothetical protein